MRETTSDASWQVSVLGGVRLIDPDGDDVDPGPAKCQELLGAFALSVDRAVSVDTLVDLLWGDDPPRTASKTLQTYVARLRKALGHDRVARVGGAYRLDLPDEWIDVRRFRAALADGDLDRALDEWSGPPLAGLDANGLRPMVDGLVEEWLVAVEVVLERSVTSDPQFVIGRLTELTARHPFREGLWALLMQALYAPGARPMHSPHIAGRGIISSKSWVSNLVRASRSWSRGYSLRTATSQPSCERSAPRRRSRLARSRSRTPRSMVLPGSGPITATPPAW